MRFVAATFLALVLGGSALVLGGCGSRSFLEETFPRDASLAEAAGSTDAGCPRGVLCALSARDAACPPGEQLCVVGCPQRQNFAPPVCMVGPCPPNGCVMSGLDGGP